LLELGLVDEVVPEPLGGAHTNPEQAAHALRDHLIKNLGQVLALPEAERLKQRYAKFRSFGHFAEKQPAPAERAEA
jgi:acetyl-CoA carboxylase carboxyl transferase subunit alpha